MSYWDTSSLVKLYVQEPDSSSFENYLLTAKGKLVTSRIALYEAYATFHRKEAEGVLQPGFAQTLYHRLLQDFAGGHLRLVDLNSDVEVQYAQVLVACYHHTPFIPLRTLDALHLASARLTGESEIVATDSRMRDAAKLLGYTLFPL